MRRSEKTGSQAYVPPDEKDDKQLHAAMDILHGTYKAEVAPKTDAPKADTAKVDAPKTDAPKTDAPKLDAPKTEAPAEPVPAK